MYGILFEILRNYVDETFGPSTWEAAVQIVNGQQLEIQTNRNYSTRLLTRIISTLCEFIGLPEEDIYYEFGIKSVDYLSNNGFQSLLQVLGKNYIDFLHNVNEMHEYLHYSYPKIKPPNIKVTSINHNVITLVYSSVREEFAHYLRSQLIYIAKLYFQLDVSAKLVDKKKQAASHIYTFKLYNKGLSWIELLEKDSQLTKYISLLDLTVSLPEKEFLGILPFHLVLTKDMTIKRVGKGFSCLRNDISGKEFVTCFLISKPKTSPNFDEVSNVT